MSTTFEDAKVGDRVWFFDLRSWGKIQAIGEGGLYPIIVGFDDGSLQTFTFEGSWNQGFKQSLFWDEIKIIAPEKPKPKVKKWKWVLHRPNGVFIIMGYHTENEILLYPGDKLQKIDSTEIEE